MKLAYLAPEFVPTWGGVGTYSVNLVRELSKMRGIDVSVFTPTRGPDYSAEKVRAMFGERITLHNLTHANDTFFYNFKFQGALWARFREYHAKERYDLVHSANLVHMPDIFLKLSGFKAPSVVTTHTTITGQIKGFLQGNKNFFRMAQSERMSLLAYPAIRFLEKQYLDRTKFAISVSRRFVDELREQGYRGEAFVVHNGIDTTTFDYARTKVNYERFAFLKDISNPIVLYAGRLVTQKGIQVFVRAMKRVLEKNREVHFVIAGPGDVAGLHRLLGEAQVPRECYTYAGVIPNNELAGLYKASDVFVLPSFYENFPISLLEANAMRCPCIATDVGATAELIDERNGILIPPGDDRILADKMLLLLSDAKLRRRLSMQGRRKVLAEFSARIMARKTVDVYRKVLS